jgi:hypothetical protein
MEKEVSVEWSSEFYLQTLQTVRVVLFFFLFLLFLFHPPIRVELLMAVDPTPFYPRGGGQVGDTGKIQLDNGTMLSVVDTLRLYEHGSAIVVQLDPSSPPSSAPSFLVVCIILFYFFSFFSFIPFPFPFPFPFFKSLERMSFLMLMY